MLNITQRMDFPTVYRKQGEVARERVLSSERSKDIAQNSLVSRVKTAYLQLQYTSAKQRLLTRRDSLYSDLDRSSRLRYEAGETTRLESITSAARAMQLRKALSENQADISSPDRPISVFLRPRASR